MSIYDYKKEIEYNGVKYLVVELLEDNLLLVIEESKANNYPCQTFVIPNINNL